MKRVYLDYASMTPIDPKVLRIMNRYYSNEYANPSSLYKEGVSAGEALSSARKDVAKLLNSHINEIFFTSGGTESNNLAIQGVIKTFQEKTGRKPHLIISNIEHSSVMEVAKKLESEGVELTIINVNEKGVVNVEDIRKNIKDNTALVSVMTVNNEIGTIMPIKEIAKVVRYARTNVTKTEFPLLHTDASQAMTMLDIKTNELGADLMTIDGTKVYGPRGVGLLYKRLRLDIRPILFGGGQESHMRPGTENIPGIVGLVEALRLCDAERTSERARQYQLKKDLYEGLRSVSREIALNPRSLDIDDPIIVPHILNVQIPGIDNEFFVLQMDVAGFAISTKSSCLHDEDESYVIRAVGGDSNISVRMSVGRYTKKSDIKRFIKAVERVLSPDL